MTEPVRFDRKGEAPQGAFSAPQWNIGSNSGNNSAGRILQPSGRPLVMGILNLTPDSFHAASRQNGVDAALRTVQTMVQAGADVLDLGAESTRPGAKEINAEQEMERLIPALEAIRQETDRPITVDTVRAETAREALFKGADAINDISGGRDPEMFKLAAQSGCGLILMHMQGTPRNMQVNPSYTDVVSEVKGWLDSRCQQALEWGVQPDRLMVDPGIGFGKTLEHNLKLMSRLKEVAAGRPLLLGASRKSFIKMLGGAETEDRLPGSLAALALAFQAGSTMVRVHDVAESVQFLDVLKGIASCHP